MQTAKGSALVAGAAVSQDMTETMRVRVVRSFLHKGSPAAVGTELDVPYMAGRELLAMRKVTEVGAEEVAPARGRGRPPKQTEE